MYGELKSIISSIRLKSLCDAEFGGDGFIRLKLPIGFRKLPSCDISENFLGCGDVAWDLDEKSEHNVILLADSIENEFCIEPTSVEAVRQVPFDPMTASNETWITEQSEPDASTPDAAAGIYNIHSGSEATALDGTSYSEW